MPSDTRKKLRTVDITCYLSVIQTFSEQIQFRNLKDKTWQNYFACLKESFRLKHNILNRLHSFLSSQYQPFP